MMTAQFHIHIDVPRARIAGRPTLPRAQCRAQPCRAISTPFHELASLPFSGLVERDGEPATTKIARDPQPFPSVLLVEDNADDAELSLLVLNKSGVVSNAKWVRDGIEAMEWLKADHKQSLKLILLDLKMPRMDGYEVLRRIRQDHTMDNIPVIVMVSAHDTPELERCFELGADSYLVKPLETETLGDAIRSLGLRFV